MVKAIMSFGPQQTEKLKWEALHGRLAGLVHLIGAEFLWELAPQSTAGGITQVAGVSVFTIDG